MSDLPIVALSSADDEVVHAEAPGWQRFVRQVGRRAQVVDAGDASDLANVAVLVVGAPRARWGPERVQRLRSWVRKGGRALVLGAEGGDHRGSLEAVSDHGLIIQGLLLPDVCVVEPIVVGMAYGKEVCLDWHGGAYTLTPRSALEQPKPGVAGALWPKGRGWFRVHKALDVERAVRLSDEAVRDKAAWAIVSLSMRRGLLAGMASAKVLSDDAMASADHVRFAADLLDHLIPAPESRVFAAGVQGAVPPDIDDPRLKMVLAQLTGKGLRPSAYKEAYEQHPVEAFAAAFRVLGTQKLATFKGERVVLTELGRTYIDVVRHVLTWRHRVLAADLADVPVS